MVAAHRSESEPACVPSYGVIPAFSDAAYGICLVLGSL